MIFLHLKSLKLISLAGLRRKILIVLPSLNPERQL